MPGISCNQEWRCRSGMVLAVIFPVLIATALSWYGTTQQRTPFSPVVLRPEMVNTVDQLEALFARYDYHWPPQDSVPPIAIRQLPQGLGELPVEQKKSLFFRLLLPLVMAENARLRAEREWLMQVRRGDREADPDRLSALADEYKLAKGLSQKAMLDQLLHRIDAVPSGLALAQAANESGWGSSRFSLEVNNLFGEWTYDESKGVVPARRPAGKDYLVRRFNTLRESVRSYLHNLNSGRAYRQLRVLRAQIRDKGKPLESLILAEGLELYSARGEEYVREIQSMIRRNGLNKLDHLDLGR